ncbi:HIT domain-containing protein [Candidatus Parcubacteria bacterium]|nr:MAG: HIT domain-containing protein [Candidatus Parcubacteria bacterium]
MRSCIFCKIVNNEIPSEAIFNDELVRVIKDINPKAPVHWLVVTKKHIPSIKESTKSEEILFGHIISVARDIAKKEKLLGYKLVFNVGKEGGQVIDHLHLHVLGGWSQTTNQVNV